MDIYTSYMHHIDDLRIQLEFNESKFVDGICSDRQYRRYLNGTSVVSQRMIRKFCERLGLTSNEFYNSFHQNDLEEYAVVANLYKHITNKNFSKALEIIEILENKSITSEVTKRFFHLCQIQFQQKTKQITNHNARDLYSSLINLNFTLKKKKLNFIEMFALMEISLIDSMNGKFEIADHVFNVTQSKNFYLSSNNRYILPSIYVMLVKIFWKKQDVSLAMKTINDGIAYSIEVNDMTALPELFYLKSYYSYVHFNKKGEAIKYGRMCLDLLKIKADEKLFEKYVKLISKELPDFTYHKNNDWEY